MEIVEGRKAEYAKVLNINTDPYGRAAINYAEAWAVAMEAALEQGRALKDCWKDLSFEVNKDHGVTGFMYGAAVGILGRFWVHGEELRRLHNIDTQIGDEGEKANETGGVLNPALLRVAERG